MISKGYLDQTKTPGHSSALTAVFQISITWTGRNKCSLRRSDCIVTPKSCMCVLYICPKVPATYYEILSRSQYWVRKYLLIVLWVTQSSLTLLWHHLLWWLSRLHSMFQMATMTLKEKAECIAPSPPYTQLSAECDTEMTVQYERMEKPRHLCATNKQWSVAFSTNGWIVY